MLVMKHKYPVSGYTRDKEANCVNGIRILVPAEYNGFKEASQERDIKPLLAINYYWNEMC